VKPIRGSTSEGQERRKGKEKKGKKVKKGNVRELSKGAEGQIEITSYEKDFENAPTERGLLTAYQEKVVASPMREETRGPDNPVRPK